MPEPTSLPPLLESVAASPTALRVGIAAIGAVLLLVGARIYRPALLLLAFAAGAVGTVALLVVVDGMTERALGPATMTLGALVGGGATAAITAAIHRLGLLGIGAVAGLIAGGAAAGTLGLQDVLWPQVAGAIVGGISFPLLFPLLLRVLTPAAGAVLLAWAAGRPDDLLLLVGLWSFGVLVQMAPGRARRQPRAEEAT